MRTNHVLDEPQSTPEANPATYLNHFNGHKQRPHQVPGDRFSIPTFS